jgi:hypothetical protein
MLGRSDGWSQGYDETAIALAMRSSSPDGVNAGHFAVIACRSAENGDYPVT